MVLNQTPTAGQDTAICDYFCNDYDILTSRTFDFDGSTRLGGGNIHTFDRTDAATWTAWVHSDFEGYICSCFTSIAGEGYGVFVKAGGQVRWNAAPIAGSTYTSVDTVGTLSAGWNHVALTKTSAGSQVVNVKCYINGALEPWASPLSDNYTSGSGQNGTNQFRVGARLGLNGSGPMKQVCVYPSTLSAGAVGVLYALGRDGDYNALSSPDSWYPMGDALQTATITDQSGAGLDLSVETGTAVYVNGDTV
jgi:hypothetical protein